MGSHVVILLQYFSFVTKRANPLPISDSVDMIAMQSKTDAGMETKPERKKRKPNP